MLVYLDFILNLTFVNVGCCSGEGAGGKLPVRYLQVASREALYCALERGTYLRLLHGAFPSNKLWGTFYCENCFNRFYWRSGCWIVRQGMFY